MRPPTKRPDDDARWQVWLLEPGANEPIRLTDEPLGVSAFRFARRADRLVVLTSVLPDVPHHAQRATQEDRKKHGPSALHYRSTPVRFWDHWLKPEFPHLVAYDAKGEHRRDLTPAATEEHRRATWDVSEDGRWAVITATRQSRVRMDESTLRVIDLESGATTTGLRTRLRARSGSGLQPRFADDLVRSCKVCREHPLAGAPVCRGARRYRTHRGRT